MAVAAVCATATAVLAGCGGGGSAGGSAAGASGTEGHPAGGTPARTAAVGVPTAHATWVGGWHGSVAPTAVPRPSFVLTDTGGRPYDFARATAGRATLLFFGYTHCPDVCPTTMADLAAARQVVGTQVARKVTVVFVTTDPDRDTPAVLRRWLDQFDPAFVGLTGTPTQLAAAQRAVGVPLATVDRDGGDPRGGQGAYLVSHAAQVLGIGPDNHVRVRYFAATTVAEYVADLPRLVALL
ncbi:SCO family protein [Frankia sp. R82]|uniref:SCO family protein n=1 Tax=Frankia sp. R82 TaxID=2950553 RepID=UPI0020439308|nr:SCO family protein [Frankia sp. R82]MCM3885886.1 SCO family protein [Frankia sp. R82]